MWVDGIKGVVGFREFLDEISCQDTIPYIHTYTHHVCEYTTRQGYHQEHVTDM